MNRAMQWIVLNAACAIPMAMALKGSEGGANLVLAMVWVAMVPSVAGACIKDVADKVRAKGRPVPASLMWSYDIVYFAALAWMGWIFTAMAWALMSAAVESIYSSEAKA